MSYLLQLRAASRLGRAARPAARVDEYTRLNRPGLYGDAFVRVFVEDTSTRRVGGTATRGCMLQIADCIEHDQPRVLARDGASSARTRSSRSTRCSTRSSASVTASPPRRSSRERRDATHDNRKEVRRCRT